MIHMTTAADHPTRPPVNRLNYAGDRRTIATDVGLGPNAWGELLYPVVAEYDDQADTTRVGLTPIAPMPVPA